MNKSVSILAGNDTNNTYTEKELETSANGFLAEYYRSNGKTTLSGEYRYSALLTHNILVAYYDEFVDNPFSSFIKYFKSANNINPLLLVLDIKETTLEELMFMRNIYKAAAQDDGLTPSELGMESYDSTTPIAVEKATKDPIEKLLEVNTSLYLP